MTSKLDAPSNMAEPAGLEVLMQEAQLDVVAEEARKAHEEWIAAVRELEATRAKFSGVPKPLPESEVNKTIRGILGTCNTSNPDGNSKHARDFLISMAKETAAWKDAQEAMLAATEKAEACGIRARQLFERMVELQRVSKE